MAGSTNFPSTLDNNSTISDLYQDAVDDVNASIVNNLGAAVKAIEAKLGVNSSAVSTSLDYFMNTVMGRSGSNISPAGTVTLTSGNFGTPVTQAFGDAASAGTGTTFARHNHVHGMPASTGKSYVKRTSNITYTSNATLADMPGDTGSIGFAILANVKYYFEFYVKISSVGTAASSGLRLAFTFPSSPNFIRVMYDMPHTSGYDATDAHYVYLGAYDGTAVNMTTPSSGSTFYSANASNFYAAGINAGLVRLRLIIDNGANAGNVVLQGAQSTSNATSTIISEVFGIMERMA